ncbi:hypothetical protein [Saccharopolyspora gloriosae]|uniref:hypothetical protein n=1 Tax=Saccharopolyspora gloriosae TaxID=455344 RepID=UPI001FB821E3|nr:hypothetical protein [Saccharopolyspora gloriosae]
MPLYSPSGDGSPDSTAPPGLPGAGGSMRVEPTAIPNLVSALQSSLDQVGVEIEHAITELRIRPWAGDPISSTAAEQFNQRSVGGDQDALTALCGYRDQLQSAAESLQLANQHYQDTDDVNAVRLGGGC